ncbi:MAG TPA: Nramp family divalent metal transporter [Fimbriimonas sp.]|nr:Nramp family divalent metal transporter [Fimbriimonas sp.]
MSAEELRIKIRGWKAERDQPSLPEVHRSISVPQGRSWIRRLLAFAGPGYLVAVGYMDPGNWATDIAGGSAYNYALLSAILLSSLMAVLLQALSAKLGIVTGRDLAQACRDAYSKPVVVLLWLSAEIAIIACDVAEVIGAAIALELLFHLPLMLGVLITASDALIILALQHKGFRLIEALVVALMGTMIVIFAFEMFYARPEWRPFFHGFLPSSAIVKNHEMLFIALGIMGATVMPHNLYLHSSIVQTRNYGTERSQVSEAIRLSYTDSTFALGIAMFVNVAILVVSAAVFHRSGHVEVKSIEDAYKMLTPLVGIAAAAPLFGVALLAAGQNSTLTGTLAGQIILEGFTRFRVKPWVRRMISRGIAIVPAVLAIVVYGDSGLQKLMILSQVVLSMQLSLAVFPLIQFTSDRAKMGEFVNGPITKGLGWTIATVILALNIILLAQS